jgi:hypothetical protein
VKDANKSRFDYEIWKTQHSITLPEFDIEFIGTESIQADASSHHLIYSYVSDISRLFDLSTLDGITISDDFPAAITALGRGYQADRLPISTSLGVAGRAITLLKRRGDVLKSHIVLDTALLRQLRVTGDIKHQTALNILFHECARVVEHAMFDRAFPGRLLGKPPGSFAEALDEIARVVWAEYFAARYSAFSYPERSIYYQNLLCTALAEVGPGMANAVTRFWVDRDVVSVIQEAESLNANVLKCAACVIGQQAGLNQNVEAATISAKVLLGHPAKPFVDRLVDVLAKLHSRARIWESFDEFREIVEIWTDLAAAGGVMLTTSPDGQSHLSVRPT